MKNLKFLLVLCFILFYTQKGYTWSKKPVIVEVISTEYLEITGTFEFQIKYKFLDTVTFSNNVYIDLPDGWSLSMSPALANNTFNENDSVFVKYDINNAHLKI
jgi:hypothetical protein